MVGCVVIVNFMKMRHADFAIFKILHFAVRVAFGN